MQLKSRIEKAERREAEASACAYCGGRPLLVPVERHGQTPEAVIPCRCGRRDAVIVATGILGTVDADEPSPIAPLAPRVVGRAVIPFAPRPWQRILDERRKRFSVVVAHRRAGKSTACLAITLAEALRERKPAPRYAYIAPFYRQARATAWEALKALATRIPGTEIYEGDTEVRLANGARIRLYGGDLPDSLRGLYFDGVVLDEYAQMRPELFGSVILPALADRSGWLIVIGTPNGVDAFSSMFFRALKDDTGDWCALRFRVEDTNAVAPAELELQRRTMSEAQFRQEFECDFDAANDDALIPLDAARAAAGRALGVNAYGYAPRIMGADIARFGDDRTVLFFRQGLQAHKPLVLRSADLMTTADAIAVQINEYRPDAVFIDQTGLGAGVVDRLRQLGHKVQGIEFGGKPLAPQYLNRRSEMWAVMRDWIRDGGCIPNDEELIADLVAPRFEFNAAGKLQLESKDSIKGRGLRSPDLADALALTFAAPVGARHVPGVSRQPQIQRADDHPFRNRGNLLSPLGRR